MFCVSASTAYILCIQWQSCIRISADDAFIVPCNLEVVRLLNSLSTIFIIFGSNYADTSLKLILYACLYTCTWIYVHMCTCICIHVHIHMCVHTNCRVPTLSSFQIACVLADAVGGPIRAPGPIHWCITLGLSVGCPAEHHWIYLLGGCWGRRKKPLMTRKCTAHPQWQERSQKFIVLTWNHTPSVWQHREPEHVASSNANSNAPRMTWT